MAKAKRVFELAKELGVSSKAIVEKCKAEEVPGVTNHMSTVKLGLQETIREWFGEVRAQTAIETAEKVDLTKAKPRKAKRRAAGEEDEGSEATTATVERRERRSGAAESAGEPEDEGRSAPEAAEAEAPSQEPAEVSEAGEGEAAATEPGEAVAKTEAESAAEGAPAETEEEASADQSQGAQEAAAAESAPPAEEAAEAPESTDEEAPEASVAGRPNVPARPKEVKPAGQQLEKPTQARLKGPNVVRIEEPEPIRRPKTKRPGGGGPSHGGAPREPEPAAGGGGVDGITRSRGPARGRGVGGGEPEPQPQRGKRRMRNVRRGRSADALPTGPQKFSQADMEELDARLKGSTGFLKQRRRDMRKREYGGQAPRPAVTGGKVEIEEPITIKSLSAATGIKTAEIIKYLFKQGVMATINSAIETEAAMEVALEYDIELEVKEQQTVIDKLEESFQQREEVDVRPRPPVVTVLGHVDHGKTSLLDKIRKADVAAHEAGGITQHIGAYRVSVEGTDGQAKTVVFLDTPGHEAFTAIRARGAHMTDLVVLVIAADDGVMPQTIESINHAKAAEVPIIVALNKIDTPQATDENIQRIYGQLAEHGLNPVEWGGETEIIRTSAVQGTGVTDVMEILDFQAELLELKADYGGPARGTVIEAEMQPGRGAVARVLVQQGEMKIGDFIVIGRAYGRVRDMTDDRGRNIEQAGPATPVELSGIDELPDAGDTVFVTGSLQEAEQAASQYRERERHQQLASKTKVTLDNFAAQFAQGEAKELRVVIKADVQGSVDVLRKSLEELGNDEVGVRVIHSAVGGVTESDVLLADASEAVVIGFNVAVTPAVREIADERKVDLRLYRVIYDVTDDVKAALEGMLEPDRREQEIGTAEVRETFKVSKVGTVAGCLVNEGSIRRDGKVRVIRDGVVVTDNRQIDSLKRVKEDAREVRAGTECGLKIAGFDDVKVGDTIACYEVVEIKRTLS